MRIAVHRSILAATASVVLAAACSSDKVQSPEQIREIVDFRPATNMVQATRNSSQALPFFLARTPAVTGKITLSVVESPSDVNAFFAPAELGVGETSSELWLIVKPSMALGSHTLKVRATADDGTTRDTSLTLNITEPDISVALTVSSFELPQNSSAGSLVTVTRAPGTTGRIALSAANLPRGVTATFSPSVLQENQTTATLTIDVSTFASVKPAAVEVVAALESELMERVPIALTVIPSGPPAVTIIPSETFVTVVAGEEASIDVIAARAGGHAGDVSLDLAPTAGPQPGHVITKLDADSFTVRFVPALTAQASNREHTIRAFVNDEIVAIAKVRVLVRIARQPWLHVTSAMTMNTNASASVAITLTRVTDYAPRVVVTADGLPPGVEVAPVVYEPPAAGNRAVTITTSASTPPGLYLVSFIARGDDGQTFSAPLKLTIVEGQRP